MERIFDRLIDSFIDNKVGIAENFISVKLSADLKLNLIGIFKNELFKKAGTGGGNNPVQNSNVRSDLIYWLSREHNDKHENAFFDVMDNFVDHLNATCYTGITGYEFHYTMYPAGGLYKRHLDQFAGNDSRKYSMIVYLNEGWKKADGGELSIHHLNSVQNISPENGKSVFFKSNELVHEVLPANKARMSITGWLKVDYQN